MDYSVRFLLEDYGINPQEYSKLEEIGGHSTYHLEGHALWHSILVYNQSVHMFPYNRVMQKAALLHDIGKIYTSIEVSPGDWIYPDHSVCGSLKGILCKFIPLDDPHFTDYQWLIKNHIKPLFWEKNGVNTEDVWGKIDESICNLENLRDLAICDLLGSKPKDPSGTKKLIEYLSSLNF